MVPELLEDRRTGHGGSEPCEGWKQHRKCPDGDLDEQRPAVVCRVQPTWTAAIIPATFSAVMKVATIFIAIVAACSLAFGAQWPKYAETGVPRDAQGRLRIDGPAPRSAEGKPDFT